MEKEPCVYARRERLPAILSALLHDLLGGCQDHGKVGAQLMKGRTCRVQRLRAQRAALRAGVSRPQSSVIQRAQSLGEVVISAPAFRIPKLRCPVDWVGGTRVTASGGVASQESVSGAHRQVTWRHHLPIQPFGGPKPFLHLLRHFCIFCADF